MTSSQPKTTPELLDELTASVAALRQAADTGGTLDAQSMKRLDAQIKSLTDSATDFDQVLRPNSVFDPGDPATSGRIIALTLAMQEKHELANLAKFHGAGVYALYYEGSSSPYEELSSTENPIYVGKATTAEPLATDAVDQGTKLHERLQKHASNILKASSTLDIKDFKFRVLVVQTGFEAAAEYHLINYFKPIWNKEQKVCSGFGKHGDSENTRRNARSKWDTLHEGREWASGTTGDQTPRQRIIDGIRNHFTTYPPKTTFEEILSEFADNLRQFDPLKLSSHTSGGTKSASE